MEEQEKGWGNKTNARGIRKTLEQVDEPRTRENQAPNSPGSEATLPPLPDLQAS